MELLTKEFILYLRGRHKLSERSLTAYQADITDFTAFFQKNAGKVPFEDGIKAAVRAYFQELLSLGYKTGTIRRKMSAIHALCRFMIQRSKIVFDPFVFMGKLKLPLYEKKEPLTAHDAVKLRSRLNDNTTGFYDSRNNVLVDMLWTYRIKLQDIVNLNVADVDLFSGTLQLPGYSQNGVIALNELTVVKLKTYFSETGNNSGTSAWDLPLFRNRYGNRLSATSIRAIVRSLAESCGIQIPVTPRFLRVLPQTTVNNAR